MKTLADQMLRTVLLAGFSVCSLLATSVQSAKAAAQEPVMCASTDGTYAFSSAPKTTKGFTTSCIEKVVIEGCQEKSKKPAECKLLACWRGTIQHHTAVAWKGLKPSCPQPSQTGRDEAGSSGGGADVSTPETPTAPPVSQRCTFQPNTPGCPQYCTFNPNDEHCTDAGSSRCTFQPNTPGCPQFCTFNPNDEHCTDAGSSRCTFEPNTPGCPQFCTFNPNDEHCVH